MIDFNILFYSLIAAFTALAVLAVIFAAMFSKKKDKPQAAAEVTDKQSPSQPPVLEQDKPSRAIEKKPLRFIVGDASNSELLITSHTPLAADAEAPMSMTPYTVPDSMLAALTKLLQSAAANDAPADGDYDISVGQPFIRAVSGGINNLPAHITKLLGADRALTVWQICKLLFGSDYDNYNDVLSSYSLYVESSTEKTLGASVYGAVSNAFAYLAPVGPLLLEQRYEASQVDYHNTQLNKIIADCSAERAVAEGKLRWPEQSILGVVFSRLGHKSRVKRLTDEIEQFAEGAFGCMLLLESAALAAILQRTLPLPSPQKKADMQAVLQDIERFRGRILSLQKYVEDRLPQLSSAFGGLLKGQHDRQREEIRAALRKRLPDIVRNLETCTGALKHSLSDLSKESDSERPRMLVIVHVQDAKVSKVYKG